MIGRFLCANPISKAFEIKMRRMKPVDFMWRIDAWLLILLFSFCKEQRGYLIFDNDVIKYRYYYK